MQKNGMFMTVAIVGSFILLLSLWANIRSNEKAGSKKPDANQIAIQKPLLKGWHVYVNHLYGFEVDYPPDWKFRDFETGAAFGPILSGKDTLEEKLIVSEVPRMDDDCKLSLLDYAKMSPVQYYENLQSVIKTVNYYGEEGFTSIWTTDDLRTLSKNTNPTIATIFRKSNQDCTKGHVDVMISTDKNMTNDTYYSKMVFSFHFLQLI